MNLFQLPLILIALITLLIIILFNWLGRRYRLRQMKKYPDIDHSHLGAIEGALLGLLTLMLAFSYGIAATRYEVGRQLIIDEAKLITTAVHQIELYPDSMQNVLRSGFKEYVDARISYFTDGVNQEKVTVDLEKGRHILDEIRKEIFFLSQDQNNNTRTTLMIPAFNNIEEAFISKEASRETKLPRIILWILLIMTAACSFLVGFVNADNKRNIVMFGVFALMNTAAFYLVIELDHPRQGFINLDAEIRDIINLRNLF
jgi:hypothetical protein